MGHERRQLGRHLRWLEGSNGASSLELGVEAEEDCLALPHLPDVCMEWALDVPPDEGRGQGFQFPDVAG
jgi:hypothetical protein